MFDAELIKLMAMDQRQVFDMSIIDVDLDNDVDLDVDVDDIYIMIQCVSVCNEK